MEVSSLFYPGCGGTGLVLSSKWKYLACSIQAVGVPDWFYLAVEVPSLFYPGCGGTGLVLSSKWKYLACSIQAVGVPDWFYLARGST